MSFIDARPLQTAAPARQEVALLNFGGPESKEAVEPFLFELFNDPAVIRLPAGKRTQSRFARLISSRRSPKICEQYQAIGYSPLVRTTAALLEETAKVLTARMGPSAPQIHLGMRYTSPTIQKMVEGIAKNPPDRLIALALFPHFSGTTTGSAFDLLSECLEKAGLGSLPVHYIPAFYEHPKYVKCMLDLVRRALGDRSPSKVHLLFSAHGLPSSYYKDGDPYPGQIHDSVRMLIRELGWTGAYSLAFQSRVGPVRWLGPSTEEELDEIAKTALREVLVVPLSFTTEGIETLYEIDVTFRQHAENLGLRLLRAKTVDTHPDFVEAVADLIESATQDLSFRGYGEHHCARCLLPKPHLHRTRVLCPDCGFRTPKYALRLPMIRETEPGR